MIPPKWTLEKVKTLEVFKWTKELRIEKQLSQKDLADLLSTGQSSISAWERGDREPLAHQLIELAQVFECSVDYLLGISDIK